MKICYKETIPKSINKKDCFDFVEILNFFKSKIWDLDDVCYDETAAYFLINYKEVKSTSTKRKIYFFNLHNRILYIKKKGEL